jgi:hypothetical protein
MYQLKSKPKLSTVSAAISPITQHLIEQHSEKVIELKISYLRLKTAFREYDKYNDAIECPKIHYSEFDDKVYNSFESDDEIRKSIDEIETHLKNMNQLFCKVLSYSDVAFRKKYGVLHTVPKNNVEMFKIFFPNILEEMNESYENHLMYHEDRTQDRTRKQKTESKVRFKEPVVEEPVVEEPVVEKPVVEPVVEEPVVEPVVEKSRRRVSRRQQSRRRQLLV